MLLGLSSCTPGSNYLRPTLDVPATFRGANAEDLSPPINVPDWVFVYDDATLRQLLKTALAQNPDIGIAAARVDEARALAGASQLQQWPQLLAAADAARLRVSQIGTTVLLPGTDPNLNVFEANLAVSYELDLWGRLHQLSAAARADLLSSEYARRAVTVTLVADVATGYFTLRALDASRCLVEKAIGNRERALALTQLLVEHGSASPVDVSRAEANLASARANLPDFVRQAEVTENQLQLLLGFNPAPIERTTTNLEALPVPLDVPSGMPSSLLERRPDILQAEAVLVASHARWRAAKAALLPTIELTSAAGTQSIPLKELLTEPTRTWSVGLGILEPIVSAGRNRQLVDAAAAREREAALQYRKVVQQAFEEVSDALIARSRQLELERAIAVEVGALERVRRQAHRRFEVGSATSFEIVDSDRDLFVAQLAAIQARRNSLIALVQIYKALGGGWAPQFDAGQP